MTLYSLNCPKCKVLEIKLKQMNLDFNLITDEEQVVQIGKEHDLNSAPILEVDGKFYDFTSAMNYLRSR